MKTTSQLQKLQLPAGSFQGLISLRNSTLYGLLALLISSLMACDTSAREAGDGEPPFALTLEEVSCPELPGLQSFSWASDGSGRFLLIGGRTDGLHQRQPFASFGDEGRVGALHVIEPATCSQWSFPLSELPVSLAEHLAVSNGQLAMRGSKAVFVGGYAYSPTFDDHMTYPYMTVIDVEAVIQAIVDGRNPGPHMEQLADARLAVTGGHLHRIDTMWYLVGGQFFDGRYNPHGPDHGPGFTQRYTDAVARFGIREGEGEIALTGYSSEVDSTRMHRRDLNVAPQVFSDGSQGLTAFSGVFRHEGDLDLPWESAVDLNAKEMVLREDFAQKLNHYHSACLPIHDPDARQMHTLFFGGIARYTYDPASHTLIDDEEVPFVKTISLVTRELSGGSANSLSESAFDLEMPGFLGANMAFLAVPELSVSEEGILDLSELGRDETQVGWLYGGIESSAPNIFWIEDGTMSVASDRLFRVLLRPAK